MFGKKKKADKGAPKAAKGASKQPKAPKPVKPSVPPDIYTVFLGLSALFFIVAVLMLGLNYHWYSTNGVIPLTWAR